MIRNYHRTSLFLFLIIIGFSSCNSDLETVRIIREPFLSVRIGSETLEGKDFKLVGPIEEVAFLSDTSRTGQKVFRYSFQSSFVNSNNQTLQLIISFDTVDSRDFRGIYSTKYTPKGGLFAVSFLKQQNASSFVKYRLRSNNSNLLEINRQGFTERIMAGKFSFTLQNERDSTDIINITQGEFEDLNY